MDQKRIIFQKPINKIIEQILENNGLKERLEDYCNKTDQGIKPSFIILYKLINDFAGGRINETLFLSNAKNELNISEQTAKNILKEIKEKILHLAIAISEEEIEKQNEATTPIQSIKQNIKTAETLPKREIIEKKDASNNISATPVKKPRKKMSKTKEKEIKNIITQPPQQKNKNDRYRELIK